MMKTCQTLFNKKVKAYTLTEILVVLVIIGSDSLVSHWCAFICIPCSYTSARGILILTFQNKPQMNAFFFSWPCQTHKLCHVCVLCGSAQKTNTEGVQSSTAVVYSPCTINLGFGVSQSNQHCLIKFWA